MGVGVLFLAPLNVSFFQSHSYHPLPLRRRCISNPFVGILRFPPKQNPSTASLDMSPCTHSLNPFDSSYPEFTTERPSINKRSAQGTSLLFPQLDVFWRSPEIVSFPRMLESLSWGWELLELYTKNFLFFFQKLITKWLTVGPPQWPVLILERRFSNWRLRPFCNDLEVGIPPTAAF